MVLLDDSFMRFVTWWQDVSATSNKGRPVIMLYQVFYDDLIYRFPLMCGNWSGAMLLYSPINMSGKDSLLDFCYCQPFKGPVTFFAWLTLREDYDGYLHTLRKKTQISSETHLSRTRKIASSVLAWFKNRCSNLYMLWNPVRRWWPPGN